MLFWLLSVHKSVSVCLSNYFLQALSNQKYREMYEEFQDVGLMTGDVTINPTASVIIMTTEVGSLCLYINNFC